MKIGQLAKVSGCTVETIRYYEREGLLPEAPRTLSNYRHYSQEHVEQLVFIRHCRTLDMSHEEIRLLLAVRNRPQADCGEVNDLVDEHIQHIEMRIRELQSLKNQLIDVRRRCSGSAHSGACGILRELGQLPEGMVAGQEIKTISAHRQGVHTVT